MTVIYVADEHHRLHWHWRETGARDLSLSRIDFHCDLRGLLIDRTRQMATVHDPHELTPVDQGNFLTHAVMDGTVTGIEWVHDRFGGRPYDLGTVRYRSDLRSRLLGSRRDGWVPLRFRERNLATWQGPAEGTHLDLDWDGLACRAYSRSYARQLQRAFLAQPFRHRPEVVYFIYSYCSSHIDDDAFEGFLDALRHKLEASVVRLSPLPSEHSNQEHNPPPLTRLRRKFTGPLKRPQRWMTRHLKRLDGGDDLAFRYPA